MGSRLLLRRRLRPTWLHVFGLAKILGFSHHNGRHANICMYTYIYICIRVHIYIYMCEDIGIDIDMRINIDIDTESHIISV